jgi:hypothetical protein
MFFSQDPRINGQVLDSEFLKTTSNVFDVYGFPSDFNITFPHNQKLVTIAYKKDEMDTDRNVYTIRDNVVTEEKTIVSTQTTLLLCTHSENS